MKTSEQINELADALAKAQSKIVGALKDSANPFFKSKYADLASVWEAVRAHLTANGLAVAQTVHNSLDGTIVSVGVTTRLMHKSGQWLEDTLILYPKDASPQGVGSAITYGRRYALAAITGCPQIDDDAEAAMGRTNANEIRGNGHAAVPPQAVAAEVEKARRILAKDIDEDAQCLEIYDLHCHLSREPDLYIATADALAEAKVLSKAQWKASVSQGKKLAHREMA